MRCCCEKCKIWSKFWVERCLTFTLFSFLNFLITHMCPFRTQFKKAKLWKKNGRLFFFALILHVCKFFAKQEIDCLRNNGKNSFYLRVCTRRAHSMQLRWILEIVHSFSSCHTGVAKGELVFSKLFSWFICQVRHQKDRSKCKSSDK